MPEPSVELIRDEAKRIHESAVYCAQGQYEAAKRWRCIHWILGVAAAALGTVGAILTFAELSPIVAGTFTILAVVVTATMTGVRPDKLAERAQAIGNDYTTLRNDARRFMNIDLKLAPVSDARERLNELARHVSDLDSAADPIPRWAYDRANKNIKEGGQNFEVDAS